MPNYACRNVVSTPVPSSIVIACRYSQHIDIRTELTVMSYVYCIIHFRLEQEVEQEALTLLCIVCEIRISYEIMLFRRLQVSAS